MKGKSLNIDQLNYVDSYTAADRFPVKVLRNTDLLETIVSTKLIFPLHVQFCPTNVCNLNCSFCSCSKRNKRAQMSIPDVQTILKKLRHLRTKAVTITGGGEPLCHPEINLIIRSFLDIGISVGLVTNGLLLERAALSGVTWCRISNNDKREFTSNYHDLLRGIVARNPEVDWAFSHVVSLTPNYKEIIRIVRFALKNDFTHVRLVSDILCAGEIDLERVRHILEEEGLKDPRVLFQGRNEPARGGPCYIGYLKPVISANGNIYTCCGAQYALSPPTRDFPAALQLGTVETLEEIVMNSHVPFDGSICKKCYYSEYNELLALLLSEIKHQEFV